MSERIFLAGASGAIGRRLVPLLLRAGHRVVGTTRTEEGAGTLRSLGAEAAVVDVFDAAALQAAVTAARPQVIVHQLTGLAALRAGRTEEALVQNAEIRIVGTRNLVEAGLAAGARRLVAQSIAWVYAPGRQPHKEEDPLNLEAEGMAAVTMRGVLALEKAVLESPPLEGVVLRYGRFYGPGTGHDAPSGAAPIHVDAAAYGALLAIDRAPPGSIFNLAEPDDLVSSDKARAALGWRPEFRLSDPLAPAS
jgi:nucleoside-diphosphate-sugar epimerase